MERVTIKSDKYHELANYLIENTLRYGSFKLSSGQQSNFYVNAKLALLSPRGMDLIADAVFEELIPYPSITAIAGMELGAVPIVCSVAALSLLEAQPLSALIVRREHKTHGLPRLVEGPVEEASNVLVVDDVATSGSSMIRAIKVLIGEGCIVPLAISVVDRNQGARESIEALGVTYRSLCTL